MRAAVIGLGNRDRGDDAAGLVVADDLALYELEVDVLAWERPEVDLLDVLPQYDHVVIVDAARSGAPPGTIHRNPHLAGDGAGLGTHGFGVGQVLELAAALDRLPAQVDLLLIEIGPTDHGAGLSVQVAAAIDDLVAVLLRTVTGGDADVPR